MQDEAGDGPYQHAGGRKVEKKSKDSILYLFHLIPPSPHEKVCTGSASHQCLSSAAAARCFLPPGEWREVLHMAPLSPVLSPGLPARHIAAFPKGERVQGHPNPSCRNWVGGGRGGEHLSAVKTHGWAPRWWLHSSTLRLPQKRDSVGCYGKTCLFTCPS